MAMIDYGALVFKNGKLINENQLFPSMQKSVGWVDVPFKKYPDCDHFFDCITDESHSDCSTCPRANFVERETYELGKWKSLKSDCKGNPPHSGTVLNGNYYGYAGNEHLTLCFYKRNFTVCVDKQIVQEIWMHYDGILANGAKSIHIDVSGLDVHIREIIPYSVYEASFKYNGDFYHVIFGYGIDPDLKVWQRVKNQYLGKKNAGKIDKLIRKYYKC